MSQDDDRRDPEVAEGLMLSKVSALAGLIALGAGIWIVAANAYDPARVVLIGLGYAVAVWAGHFMIGWGALRNYARIMDREQRHYEDTRRQLAGIREQLADTSARSDMLARLERIEDVQRREVDTLGDMLDQNDEMAEQRRRSNSR